MYIVRSGLLNKVLTKELCQQLENGEKKAVSLIDTVRDYKNSDGEVIQYLPFRLCYHDIDKEGKKKYVYNEQSGEYEPSYFYTPVMYAYGKEMRILLELGENTPIKVVYKEQWNDGDLYRTAICIQDNTKRTLE